MPQESPLRQPGQQQASAAATAARSTRYGGVLKLAMPATPKHLNPLTATARDAQITLSSTWVRNYKPSFSIQAGRSAAAATVWIDRDKLPSSRR